MTPEALVVTRLSGPEDGDQTERRNPRWEDIEQAIRRLDGNTCTLVTIGIGEAPVPHMAIGGGENGKYIVYSTPDNMTFHTLVDPSAPGGKCFLVAGGQRGRFERKICVNLADALRAAKTYAEKGETDTALTWQGRG